MAPALLVSRLKKKMRAITLRNMRGGADVNLDAAVEIPEGEWYKATVSFLESVVNHVNEFNATNQIPPWVLLTLEPRLIHHIKFMNHMYDKTKHTTVLDYGGYKTELIDFVPNQSEIGMDNPNFVNHVFVMWLLSRHMKADEKDEVADKHAHLVHVAWAVGKLCNPYMLAAQNKLKLAFKPPTSDATLIDGSRTYNTYKVETQFEKKMVAVTVEGNKTLHDMLKTVTGWKQFVEYKHLSIAEKKKDIAVLRMHLVCFDELKYHMKCTPGCMDVANIISLVTVFPNIGGSGDWGCPNVESVKNDINTPDGSITGSLQNEHNMPSNISYPTSSISYPTNGVTENPRVAQPAHDMLPSNGSYSTNGETLIQGPADPNVMKINNSNGSNGRKGRNGSSLPAQTYGSKRPPQNSGLQDPSTGKRQTPGNATQQ